MTELGHAVAPAGWRRMAEQMIHERKPPLVVTSPPDGKIPPLTAEGHARFAARQEAQLERGPADSWLDLDLSARCITQGLPGSMMPGTSGNSYEIVQAPRYVAIRYERMHEVRVIRLDGRPRANVPIRAHMGDSRGRFQGDTLIVETTNFRDESVYREANPDRLRLVGDPPQLDGRLEWSVTVERSEHMDRAVDVLNGPHARFRRTDHGVCLPRGKRAMANTLSGARAEERAFRETLEVSVTRNDNDQSRFALTMVRIPRSQTCPDRSSSI